MAEADVGHYVRGIPLPISPWFPEKNIIDTLDYIPRDDDIILSSYPKTGTSWLQFIVQQIISKGGSLPDFDELYYKLIPQFEMAGLDVVESLTEPRIYKHHFAFTDVQKDHKARFLYIYRNPEDVFVSYYHFYGDQINEEVDIDKFLDDFLTGKVWYGDYCDHVLSYLNLQKDNKERILMVSYESLSANRKEEILRVARFLGEEYFKDLVEDGAILDRIVEHTEFEYMKKTVAMVIPEIPRKGESPDGIKTRKRNYFRKGIVGDGKKTLSEAQLKRLRDHVATKMKGTSLEKEWLHT